MLSRSACQPHRTACQYRRTVPVQLDRADTGDGGQLAPGWLAAGRDDLERGVGEHHVGGHALLLAVASRHSRSRGTAGRPAHLLAAILALASALLPPRPGTRQPWPLAAAPGPGTWTASWSAARLPTWPAPRTGTGARVPWSRRHRAACAPRRWPRRLRVDDRHGAVGQARPGRPRPIQGPWPSAARPSVIPAASGAWPIALLVASSAARSASMAAGWRRRSPRPAGPAPPATPSDRAGAAAGGAAWRSGRSPPASAAPGRPGRHRRPTLIAPRPAAGPRPGGPRPGRRTARRRAAGTAARRRSAPAQRPGSARWSAPAPRSAWPVGPPDQARQPRHRAPRRARRRAH